MSKGKQSRKVGHDRFLERLNERNRLSDEAAKAFKQIDIRAVTQFILTANPDEAADRTMMKPVVLQNIQKGRIDPSKNQTQQILRAAGEMGWKSPQPGA